MPHRRARQRLVREGSRDIAEVASNLGVSIELLRNWIKRAELDRDRRKDGLTTDEREELRLLRRENRDLRKDREILTKAAPSPNVPEQTASVPPGWRHGT